MIESMSAADVTDAARFERVDVVADARAAGRIRDEFGQWLREHFDLDPTRTSDVILSVNEALANCAEFAYVGSAHVGTMDVRAWYDQTLTSIVVVVTDRGRWRSPDSPRQLSRGRGIPLMEALSDRTTIDASDAGTEVRLEWAKVTRTSSG